MVDAREGRRARAPHNYDHAPHVRLPGAGEILVAADFWRELDALARTRSTVPLVVLDSSDPDMVRAALEELASRDADIARSVVEKQPVNITLTGDAVSTDKVRELLEELNGRSEDLDIRVTQLEEPEDDDLLDAINSRRRY